MSDAIQEALSRRAALQEQIDMIDKFLDLHRRIFGDKVAGGVVVGDAAEGEIVPASREQTERPSNNPEALVAAIEETLSDVPEPMTRGQIRKALIANGITIHSKDISKYLGTLMWRNQNRFINIEGEGYWLKSRPLPERLSGKDELFQ